MVDREKESPLLDPVAADGDAGALELVVPVIPELGLPAFRVHRVGRLPGIDSAKLALSLLPRPFPKGTAEAEQEKKA